MCVLCCANSILCQVVVSMVYVRPARFQRPCNRELRLDIGACIPSRPQHHRRTHKTLGERIQAYLRIASFWIMPDGLQRLLKHFLRPNIHA
jgi:hypothetical protein